MILIPGDGISANGPHLLHVGVRARVEPHLDRHLSSPREPEGVSLVEWGGYSRKI
jgi:hypothetical protein